MTDATSAPDNSKRSEPAHVAVLGAGMAGLAAGAAAAAVADRVTVLDRDELPDEAVARRGTPQAHHIHGLMAGGRRALDDLLPGFDARLEAAGAREVTTGGGFGFRPAEGWMRDVPDLRMRCVTRPVVEACARRLLRERTDVQLLGDWQVDGLTVDGDGRVDGVSGTHDGQEQTLSADLVVDATGRGSHAPPWLEELGHDRPTEEVIDPELWYASTVGHGDADLPEGMAALLLAPAGEDTGGGGIVSAEDGSYVVTVMGADSGGPPQTADDFRSHARRLRSPAIARAIAPLELEDRIVPSRSTSNRLRAYHRTDLPAGLVLLGDSFCAYDPIYGQGMTVAAIQARELRTLLSEDGIHHPDLTERFQDRAWDIAEVAWDQAVAADLELPTVDAEPSLRRRAIGAYARRAVRLAAIHPDVARRVGRVLQFVDPPQRLFHPALVARVLIDLVRPAEPPAHPADQPA